MCVVNLKSVNKLDLTWKQSFLIYDIGLNTATCQKVTSTRCHQKANQISKMAKSIVSWRGVWPFRSIPFLLTSNEQIYIGLVPRSRCHFRFLLTTARETFPVFNERLVTVTFFISAGRGLQWRSHPLQQRKDGDERRRQIRQRPPLPVCRRSRQRRSLDPGWRILVQTQGQFGFITLKSLLRY